MLAKGGYEHIVFGHRGADANSHALLPERGCIGTQLARTLESDGTRIEYTGPDHRPQQLDRRGMTRIAREVRQLTYQTPIRIENAATPDLEARDDITHAGTCGQDTCPLMRDGSAGQHSCPALLLSGRDSHPRRVDPLARMAHEEP